MSVSTVDNVAIPLVTSVALYLNVIKLPFPEPVIIIFLRWLSIANEVASSRL